MQHDVTYSWMQWEEKGTAALHRQDHFSSGCEPWYLRESESLSRSQVKLPPETTEVLSQKNSLFLPALCLFSLPDILPFAIFGLTGLKTLLTFNQGLPVGVNLLSLVY